MDKKFCNEVLNCFGVSTQIDKCIEECAELTKALMKYKSSVTNYKNIANCQNDVKEELIDVQIMLEQMFNIFGKDDKIYDYKVNRLKERVEEMSCNKSEIISIEVPRWNKEKVYEGY